MKAIIRQLTFPLLHLLLTKHFAPFIFRLEALAQKHGTTETFVTIGKLKQSLKKLAYETTQK